MAGRHVCTALCFHWGWMTGNPEVIVGTNPTDEPITSDVPVIQAKSLGMVRDIKQRTSIYAMPVSA
jgi:hypothetical protein